MPNPQQWVKFVDLTSMVNVQDYTKQGAVIETFKGFVVSNGGNASGHFKEPYANYAADPATNPQTQGVCHFRLPYKDGSANGATPAITTGNNAMYRLHFEGYAYGGTPKVIDFTAAGYCYSGDAAWGLHSPEVYGSHVGRVTQYVGSDRYIYIRVDFGDRYYLTLNIGSMYVGNGAAIPVGEIKAIWNSAQQL